MIPKLLLALQDQNGIPVPCKNVQLFNVFGTTSIWMCRVSNICFDFLNCTCLKKNNNKYSKFDTSKLMSYQGHSKMSRFCFDCILKRAHSALITYALFFGMWSKCKCLLQVPKYFGLVQTFVARHSKKAHLKGGHIPFWSQSEKSTLHLDRNPKRAYWFSSHSKRGHSILITFHKGHILFRSHSILSTFQKGHISFG